MKKNVLAVLATALVASGGLFAVPSIALATECIPSDAWIEEVHHEAVGEPTITIDNPDYIPSWVEKVTHEGVSCDIPKPDQPQTHVGDEQRTSDPVCVVPADGTQVSYLENRLWSQEWVWDESSWSWVLDKRVFGEWELADTIIVKNEECDSAKEELPVVPEEPTTPTETETIPVMVEASNNELALTGSSPNVGIFAGIGLLLTGIAAFGVKLLRKHING